MVYDYLFVGSSPMNILEACSRRLQGYTTVIIDSSSELGGAWKTHRILDLDDIENGPHFLQHSKSEVSFLSHDLDLELIKVPKPDWVVDRSNDAVHLSDRQAHILMALHRLLSPFGINMSPLLRLSVRNDISGSSFLEKVRLLISALTGRRRSGNIYLQNGTGPFMRRISAVARGVGVEFKLSEKVIEVQRSSPTASSLTVWTSNGSYDCRNLILTRHSRLHAMVAEGNTSEISTHHRSRTTVHFTIRSKSGIPFYLKRFFSDRYFLLSNLSAIYRHLDIPADCRLLTLAFADVSQPMDLDHDDMEQVLVDLVRLRVLPADSKLIDFSVSCYDDSVVTDESLERLVKFGDGRIVIFGDLDLTRLLRKKVGTWRARGFNAARLAKWQFL